MRPNHPPTTNRRELIVTAVLGLLLGVGVFLYLMIIGGTILIALAMVLTILAIVGGVHYWLWGRRMAVRARAERSTRPEDRPRGRY